MSKYATGTGRQPTARFLIVMGVCLSGLPGCETYGALLGVKPDQTVSLISASPNQATLEYTHHYSSELPAAGRIADQQCNRFSKYAAPVGVTRKDLDRSFATFRCE